MIKKPLFITVSICAVGLVVFIAVQQIANVRRGNAIENHISGIRSVLVDNGFDDDEIKYSAGCESGQAVFGEGQKSCWRRIEVVRSSIFLEDARDIFKSLEERLESHQNTEIRFSSNTGLSLMAEGAGGVSGFISMNVGGRAECSLSVRYESEDNDMGRIESITEASFGEVRIADDCNDTSWWMRQGLF